MKNNSLSSLAPYTPYLTRIASGIRYTTQVGLLSLSLVTAATAADFSGSLKGVTITDAASANKPPVATFTYAINGNTITFDASGSTDTDGTITAYKWDFGDGSTGSGPKTQHTYSTRQNIFVTITTTDNNNGIALYRNAINFNSCSSTPSYSQTTVAYDTTYWAAYDFVGAKYSGSGVFNICSIKFYVSAIIGDLSSETIFAQMYSLSGTSLGTLLGQKQLTPSSVTTGWNTVTFDSPITTGGAGFAVVFSKSSGETNYIKYGYSGNSSSDWGSGSWRPDKSIERDIAEDFSIEIFE